MATEEFYDDEFIINLTIDGTSYEEVEVKVTDPNKTIRDQISSIVSVRLTMVEIQFNTCSDKSWKMVVNLKFLNLKMPTAVNKH